MAVPDNVPDNVLGPDALRGPVVTAPGIVTAPVLDMFTLSAPFTHQSAPRVVGDISRADVALPAAALLSKVTSASPFVSVAVFRMISC